MQRAGHSFGNFLLKNLGKQGARFSTVETAEPLPNLDISKEAKKGRAIYFDMQATTPMDFRVLDAMLPYCTNMFGNPHSKNHEYGWETENAVKKAREQIAKLINADSKEIIFTSGATESNNLALKGLAGFYKTKKHLITTVTEHKCVLDTCRHLEDQGYQVDYLPVQPNGLLDLNLLKEKIRPDTLFVSVMFVNNEIGVIQDVKTIGKICRDAKAFFHTDAAQAVGKVPIDVKDMNIDLLSISGHKLYGPKGIGALYRRVPKVKLQAQINGGGQERGLRSGTLPPPLIVGFGAACDIALKDLKKDEEHIRKLANKLKKELQEKISDIQINGDETRRYCGNLNVSFAYVEGESLLMNIKSIAVSSGSACTSESLEPSYVLRALGVKDEMAHTSIRFGIGRFTSEEEIDYLVEKVVSAVQRLREMSPLWEMAQEGIDLDAIQWNQPH